jgi:hypothetical protein
MSSYKVERKRSGKKNMDTQQHRFSFLFSCWWQWVAIAAVNIAALLNYLEIMPFLYSVYPMDAFELILRCLFSDIIAFSERKGRNVPVIWWPLAFLFLPVTLFYLYFFPFDKDRQEGTQRKLDAGFAVVCVMYSAIPFLYSIWSR